MQEIKLQFSIEVVNQLLSFLGRLPFVEVNNLIQTIVEEANKQIATQESSLADQTASE